MIQREIVVRRIGHEGQPVVIIDGFHPDPDALRAAAGTAPFGPARNHYPGVRADLPGNYFANVGATMATAMRDIFGRATTFDVIDSSFSIVTTPPAELTLSQRLPHVDAVEGGRIALVHYLSRDDDSGTAFFRHRGTGFETIDKARAAVFYPYLDAELRSGKVPPPAYLHDSTPLFERTTEVEPRYNRAVIYRSAMLHSGAIRPAASLDADPATGRLTVTAFFMAG